MKFNLTPLFLISAFLIFLSSCSEKAKVPVPADAAFVMQLNGASLHSKLSWDEIKQGDIFKKAVAFVSNEQLKAVLDNPDVSGIDIKTDAYLFMKKQGKGGYAGFTCEIKDEKTFNDLIEKINNSQKPSTEDGLSSIKTGKGIVVTWSSHRLVIIADRHEMGNGHRFGGKMKNTFSENHPFPEDSLLLFAKEIHNLKKDKSLGANDKFNGLLKESGDIHFWMNTGKTLGDNLPAQVKNFSKTGDLLQNNITAATLNFENGRISINTKNYLNKDLADLFKKYPANNLDENMLKMIPSENIDAVFAMNYPPAGLQGFLQLLGIDGLVNGLLNLSTKSTFSMEDIINSSKGDLMLALTDFKMSEKKEIPAGDKDDTKFHGKQYKGDVKILFVNSVNDKTSFQKMIDLLKNMGGKFDDINKKMGGISYSLEDNWFIAGSDSTQVKGFGKTLTDHPFISKISGHPVGGYIDIQKMIAGASQDVKDSLHMILTNESAKLWQDVIFYCDNYSGDAMQGHIEINMLDKNSNSLKQFWNYLNAMEQNIMQRKDFLPLMKDKMPIDKIRPNELKEK